MAYVKIHKRYDLQDLENYIFKGRDKDDPIEFEGCSEGMVTQQFIGTQMNFGIRKNNFSYHIIQNFGIKDSSKLAPEEYARIGRKLIEQQFPGHDFVVVSHIENGDIHNHIMLNPVHSETGKRIQNKKKNLYDLRDKSDELCLAAGLTIIEAQSKQNWKNAPEKVRNIKRSAGFSWVLDLKEKADFARSISTTFDEYSGVLNKFGIHVRVENKNISYHYPERRAKRGDSYGLGEKYSKSKLVEDFKKNYEAFFQAGLKKEPIEKVNFLDHWEFHRKDSNYITPEYRYKNLVIPPDLIERIQKQDIKEIAKQNGQELVKDENGDFRLKNKEYIVLRQNRWLNEKTKTQGGTLEFVNFCYNESWLKTISRFDSFGIVNRVADIAEEKTPSFKAFYISPRFKTEKQKEKVDIDSFFSDCSKALKGLSRVGRIKVYPGEKAKFYSQEFPKSSLTIHKTNKGWVSRQKNGISGTFFKKIRNSKDPFLIFEDPISFGASGKIIDRIINDKKPINIIAPLKPLDEFLNENAELFKGNTNLRVVRSKEHFSWGREGEEKTIENEQRSEYEKKYGLKFDSIEDLFKELILGRSR